MTTKKAKKGGAKKRPAKRTAKRTTSWRGGAKTRRNAQTPEQKRAQIAKMQAANKIKREAEKKAQQIADAEAARVVAEQDKEIAKLQGERARLRAEVLAKSPKGLRKARRAEKVAKAGEKAATKRAVKIDKELGKLGKQQSALFNLLKKKLYLKKGEKKAARAARAEQVMQRSDLGALVAMMGARGPAKGKETAVAKEIARLRRAVLKGESKEIYRERKGKRGAKRAKKATAATRARAKSTSASWIKAQKAAGLGQGRMTKAQWAEFVKSWPGVGVSKPTGPLPGLEGYSHVVAIDPWRPYVQGKTVPGYHYTPPKSARISYRKNAGRKGRRNAGIIARIKRGVKSLFKVKSGKKGARRNPGVVPVLQDVAFGTGAFITGRLMGNLAKRTGWFEGNVAQYTPFGASLVNLLAMHLASTRVKALTGYRAAMMVGAGIQAVETAIDAFAPAKINDLFDRPGGLGADLNVYEAALSDDLGYDSYDLGASDEELLAAAAGMGEYISLEGDGMGEYVDATMGEYLLPAEDDMGEYVSLEGENELAEYIALEGEDELAEELLADDEIDQLIGDDELADEVLADEVLADDLADDLGAIAAPAPAPTVTGASVPAAIAKRGPKAVAAWRRRQGTAAQRRAAVLTRQGGHPAGGKAGQVLTGTQTGGIFGRMAAAPKEASGLTATKLRTAVRRAVPAATAATGAAPGTPAHFATTAAAVQQHVGVAVPPAATLAAYRAETAGPAAAMAAARKVRARKMLTVKGGAKPRVIVRRGTGGMPEFSRPTTKRALVQPRIRSVYDAPVKEDEEGIFKGDIFSGDRV